MHRVMILCGQCHTTISSDVGEGISSVLCGCGAMWTVERMPPPEPAPDPEPVIEYSYRSARMTRTDAEADLHDYRVIRPDSTFELLKLDRKDRPWVVAERLNPEPEPEPPEYVE